MKDSAYQECKSDELYGSFVPAPHVKKRHVGTEQQGCRGIQSQYGPSEWVNEAHPWDHWATDASLAIAVGAPASPMCLIGLIADAATSP